MNLNVSIVSNTAAAWPSVHKVAFLGLYFHCLVSQEVWDLLVKCYMEAKAPGQKCPFISATPQGQWSGKGYKPQETPELFKTEEIKPPNFTFARS